MAEITKAGPYAAIEADDDHWTVPQTAMFVTLGERRLVGVDPVRGPLADRLSCDGPAGSRSAGRSNLQPRISSAPDPRPDAGGAPGACRAP